MTDRRGLLPEYGIDPLSSLVRSGCRLHTLVVAALLDRGHAMTLESIARDLLAAGLGGRGGHDSVDELVHEIRSTSRNRTYRERTAVQLTPDGKLALVLQGHSLSGIILDFTWKATPRPVAELPDDGQRLQLEELEAFVALRPFGSVLSVSATVAALADAKSTSLDEREIIKFFRAAGVPRGALHQRLDASKLARSQLLHWEPSGRISLREGAPIERVRRRLRECLQLEATRRDEHDDWAMRREESKRKEKRRTEQARKNLRRVRRALLHAAPSAKRPLGLAIVDIGRRTIRVLRGNDLDRVQHILEAYDVLVGFDLYPLLHSLGLDYEHWHLVRLEPGDSTLRNLSSPHPARARVTAQRLVEEGLGRRLTPQSEYERLIRASAFDAFERALATDARSLFALHRLGVLQGRLPCAGHELWVDYRLRGESSLHDLYESATTSGRSAEVVLDEAPDLEAPWERAHALEPIAWFVPVLLAAKGGRVHVISDLRIKEARVAPVSAPSNVISLFEHEAPESAASAEASARVEAGDVGHPSWNDEVAGRRELIERFSRDLDDTRLRTAVLDRAYASSTMEALANLLVGRFDDVRMRAVTESLQSSEQWWVGWFLGSVLSWMADSSDVPEGARSLATHLLLQGRPSLGAELAARSGRSDLMLEAVIERQIAWLPWRSPQHPAEYTGGSRGSPVEFARDISGDLAYGVASLNAHKLARATLGLSPAAAHADLIFELEPGPLRDMLAFDLLGEPSWAACTLFDRVRNQARGADMIRAYDRASLLLHTARCEAAAKWKPLARAWLSSSPDTRSHHFVIPLRRTGQIVISDPEAGFGIEDANTSIELLARLPIEDRLTVAPLAAPEAASRQVGLDIHWTNGRIADIEITRSPQGPLDAGIGSEIDIETAARECLGGIARALADHEHSFAYLIKAASLLEAEIPGAFRLNAPDAHPARPPERQETERSTQLSVQRTEG